MVDKNQIKQALVTIGKGMLWIITGIVKIVIKAFATVCRWIADELTKPSPVQRRKEQQENTKTVIIVRDRCERQEPPEQDPFDVVYSSKRMFGRRR
jgi:hypothetical protein